MSPNQTELIDQLETRLGHLAMEWRSTHSKKQFTEAQRNVDEYHAVIDQLWNLGWDGEGLLPDSELPDELMPKYFLEYWQSKNNE